MGVAAGLALVLVWVALRGGPAPEPATGPVEAALIPTPFVPTALELHRPDGTPWSLADEEDRMVALFFGYANCPDVCPLTLNRLGRIQVARQQSGAGGPELRVVFVSVDPARDSAAILRRYVERLPGEIVAASAPDVRDQAFEFGVRVADRPLPAGGRPEDPGHPYLVDHTARTFIVDPAGRVTATLPPMASLEEMEAILDAVYRRWEEDGA